MGGETRSDNCYDTSTFVVLTEARLPANAIGFNEAL
jgi:hypothetical protein